MINNNYQKNYILSYQFVPTQSCTIDSINVDIGGKISSTKPINITVKAYQKSADDDFELTLITDKKDLYVGEPFTLKLIFKQKNDAEAVDSKFIQPDFKGFWIKSESKAKQYKKGKFTYSEVIYSLAAQRKGKLIIQPAQMKIATRVKGKNSWGSWVLDVKWKNYFSDKLEMNVLEIPQGVTLVGDFTIESNVDKTTINMNEAVNVTITVKGNGNFEDIASFKPTLNGVSVFDEKGIVKKSSYTQKIALVADKDFVVPAFSIKYFDLKTKTIKTVQTQEIKIKVNGVVKDELTIKRDVKDKVEVVKVVQTETSNILLISIFILGLIIGSLVGFFKPWIYINIKKEKKVSLKDPKTLLIKLMPYQNDSRVADLIEKLEKNIYSNSNIEIDKKLVKELIKEYQFKL